MRHNQPPIQQEQMFYPWGTLVLSSGAIDCGIKPLVTEGPVPYSRDPLDPKADPEPLYPQVAIVVHAKGEEPPELRARQDGSLPVQVVVNPDSVLARNTENTELPKLKVIDVIMRAVCDEATLYNNRRRRTPLRVRLAEFIDDIRLAGLPGNKVVIVGKPASMIQRQTEEDQGHEQFIAWLTRDLFNTFFGMPEQPDQE